MPGLNGTGPLGKGPGTGRGMGWCSAGRRPPGRIFLSLAAAAVGVVVKDTMNPDGIARKVFRALGHILTPRLREPGGEPARTVREVEVEVLPGPRDLKREGSGNDAAR